CKGGQAADMKIGAGTPKAGLAKGLERPAASIGGQTKSKTQTERSGGVFGYPLCRPLQGPVFALGFRATRRPGKHSLPHIDLAAAPFHLDGEATAWVHATRDAFSPRDKRSQLSVLMERGTPDQVAEAVRSFKPGGITRIYSDDLVAEVALARDLFALSAVP